MSELDYAKEQSAMDDDWCDDCHGYTHAPWCPNYRAPDEISDEEYRQLDQEQNWLAAQTEPLVKIISERSRLRVENERLRETLLNVGEVLDRFLFAKPPRKATRDELLKLRQQVNERIERC